MRYIHWLLCAALLSFLLGLIYSTESRVEVEESKPVHSIRHVSSKTLTQDLPDCSKVNTMPCVTYTPDPVKEELDSQTDKTGLFKVKEEVTCIYPGIFWWDNRDEFVKTVPMVCTVVQASEAWNDLAPNYQHIQVDCSKDLATKWSDQPGAGMVKGHKLNPTKRWFTSDDCYHFVQH